MNKGQRIKQLRLDAQMTQDELAGHESVAVTAKYYAFVDAKEMTTAIDKL